VIRLFWVTLYLLVVTPLLSLIIIIRSFFPGSAEPIYDGIPRLWARWTLRVSGTPVTAIGAHHIAPGRPQIFLCNHASWYDVLALATIIPKRYRFVGKKELARVPLWGRAWLASGHIAIDRSDTVAAVESLDRAGRMVREDRSAIIIFPEGTRSATGELLPFKKGAFMLAMHTGIEIVPVAVQGTRAIMPKGSWRVRPGRIIVRFGAPISAATQAALSRDELMSRVRAEIQALLDARMPEPGEGHVGDRQYPRP
jgi:1-acyl-sn-glycerol-3-phosphate acyltransferase